MPVQRAGGILVIIALMGYRATGKSTVGQLLADRLGWTCVDTDVEVQRLVGSSIRDIFQHEGEAKFRQYESQVIQQLTRRHKLVLAEPVASAECGRYRWLRFNIHQRDSPP